LSLDDRVPPPLIAVAGFRRLGLLVCYLVLKGIGIAQKVGQIESEWAKLGLESSLSQREHHHQGCARVVRMNNEAGRLQVRTWFPAKPAYHLHPTIAPVHVHESLAPEVVVEVDFDPGLHEPADAILSRLHPDRMGTGLQESLGSPGIVVEKEETRQVGHDRIWFRSQEYTKKNSPSRQPNTSLNEPGQPTSLALALGSVRLT
jgi:hypothetical protein